VVKFVNEHVNPLGGSQRAIASAVVKARYTLSGFAASTRCAYRVAGGTAGRSLFIHEGSPISQHSTIGSKPP
jgi:hypothetical protein